MALRCKLGLHDLPDPDTFDLPGGRTRCKCARCGQVFKLVNHFNAEASRPYLYRGNYLDRRYWAPLDAEPNPRYTALMQRYDDGVNAALQSGHPEEAHDAGMKAALGKLLPR
jgi:hypothetical protein